ncbi:phage holin family protein [Enterobacter cloacae complex sp. 279F5]
MHGNKRGTRCPYPVSGTTVAAGGLMGASMFGLATGIDYGVVFGAFAGAVFYVATAVNISRLKLVGYFITSFIFGVIGAPLLGSYFSKWTGYSDRPLDALGAVIVAAIAIKLLTFVNSQDLGSLFGILSRLRGGGASNGNK